jgi:hypothetical protein
LLDHLLIGGRFNHAELRSITIAGTTEITPVLLGKAITLVAMTYRGNRIGERPREQTSPLAIMLQKVPCKALRGFWTNPRQTAQGIHQGFQNHWLTVEVHE